MTENKSLHADRVIRCQVAQLGRNAKMASFWGHGLASFWYTRFYTYTFRAA